MRDKRMRGREEQVVEEGDIGCVKRRTLQSDWSKHNARGIQMHCDGKRGVPRGLMQRAARADAACYDGRYTTLARMTGYTSGWQGALKPL